jgi:hypothetical protein
MGMASQSWRGPEQYWADSLFMLLLDFGNSERTEAQDRID